MKKRQIEKWLSDFHDDLENRTDKTHLNLQQLLQLMPEECGRTYIDMANKTFGTDVNYAETVNRKNVEISDKEARKYCPYIGDPENGDY
mgnify:CR=1 FL=1